VNRATFAVLSEHMTDQNQSRSMCDMASNSCEETSDLTCLPLADIKHE
jgi:hypothetical protein